MIKEGEQMLRDLKACNRMAEDIIAERDRLKEEVARLRSPMALWKVRDLDEGEVMDWFLAPVGWKPTPNGVIERFQLAHDARVELVQEVPRGFSDEEILGCLKRRS